MPPNDKPRELVLLDRASRALAEATTLDEIKDIRDKAEAARKYAQSAALGLEIQNHAAEIKLRAERKAGEILTELPLRGGDRRSNSHDESLKLIDLGISHNQSHRWQRSASVTQDDFEQFVESTNRAGRELTSAGLLKIAKQTEAVRRTQTGSAPSSTDGTFYTDLNELIATGQKFGCIYADQSHLHLWTTNAFLFDAKKVIEAWGFEYKSCFVWVKPQLGIGNYWRVSHEFLLLGTRGNAPFNDHSLRSWQELPRTEHSEKPCKIRTLIEMVSEGPYVELFARHSTAHWTTFGAINRG